jgi:hypothetical protein
MNPGGEKLEDLSRRDFYKIGKSMRDCDFRFSSIPEEIFFDNLTEKQCLDWINGPNCPRQVRSDIIYGDD